MITIINVGPSLRVDVYPDECVYEVKINRQSICRFVHRRGKGLADCLHQAAMKVAEVQARSVAKAPTAKGRRKRRYSDLLSD